MEGLWLLAAVILAVIEAATVQFVSLWFACGAVCAFIAAFFTKSIAVQLVVFVVTSVLFLVFAGRYVRRLTKNKTATNADSLIGKTAILTETADNERATGELKINGLTWMARPESGVIEAGERVEIVRIDGVKLIVRKEG